MQLHNCLPFRSLLLYSNRDAEVQFGLVQHPFCQNQNHNHLERPEPEPEPELVQTIRTIYPKNNFI